MTEHPNKKVLIIAYHYPPLAGAGMLKILRTTRYLNKYNWRPWVLTVKNPESYHRAENPIPPEVSVRRAWRIPGGNLLARILRRLGLDERWLMLPDQHVLWIPGAFFCGLYLIWRKKLDLIYVTGPPYSALLVGVFLKKCTKKPLVVEIRDPWSFNGARQNYPTPLHRKLDLAWERLVLQTADQITCIYKITQLGYQQLYPWTQEKLTVFYDTIDLADLPTQVEAYSKFTLSYLGTFYPPFQSLRATLAAIQLLVNQQLIDREKFCFNYVGPTDFSFERFIKEFGLEAYVKQTGYLPLKEAQLEVAKSQMLLLLLEFPTINTKLFDYLATGKAILAVVPECAELNELLEKYADQFYQNNDCDPKRIATEILRGYRDFCEGKIMIPTKVVKFREEMHIEVATKALGELFDRISSAT